MTTAQRLTDVRAFVDTEPMTPEQARENWLECADTDAEEDLAYSIAGPAFLVVLVIFITLLAAGLLVKFGFLLDPGVM